MPSPTRVAIYDKLAGDATLMGMLANGEDSIYYAQVDEKLDDETEMPIIIYHKNPGGTPRYTFGSGPPLKWNTWVVKAIGNRNICDDIAARIVTVLDHAELTLTSGQVLDVRQASDYDQTETINGERYDHVGHLFRVVSEEE